MNVESDEWCAVLVLRRLGEWRVPAGGWRWCEDRSEGKGEDGGGGVGIKGRFGFGGLVGAGAGNGNECVCVWGGVLLHRH